MPDSSSSAIATAAGWAAQLLSGSLATILALVAIALVGFALLQGEIPLRRGTQVVLGCFVVFGAPLTATELLQLAQGWEYSRPSANEDQGPVLLNPVMPSPADPYAGAAVPQ